MKTQTPTKNQIKLLASGKGWVAVDKPAGMSIHNDPGEDLCSLLSRCLQTNTTLREDSGLTPESRLNAVHRLDRETSGVILLAGNTSVLNHFARQFENRTVEKRYTALLHGRLSTGKEPGKWNAWTWSLTKTPGGRKDPRGRGPRKTCTTLFRPLGHSDHYTLVECRLLTGRKHQIRRHAKLAGHPVVGDRRYGPKRAVDFLKARHHFNRLGLHATRLEIRLPQGSATVIQSPQLPPDLQRLFDTDQ